MVSSSFSKGRVNGLFRQALVLLKEGYVSEGHWLWNQRLAAAIMIKTELAGYGYVWQAKRIENLIHRYQGKINRLQANRPDLKEREREEASF